MPEEALNMQTQARSNVACVILAAGGGTRLGGGKMLLPWKGKPLVAHVLETALCAEAFPSVTIVLGHDALTVRAALQEYANAAHVPVHFVENFRWQQGQSTSLQCGIAALGVCADKGAACVGPQSIMVLLGDQPLVAVRTLRALIAAHLKALRHNAAHPATVPVYQGVRGNPVIVSRSIIPEILALQGDIGARHVLERQTLLLRLPVHDAGVVHDVDTPEAYAALCALHT